jgi:pyruvate/2-oxoacid:ferredoxin oxidoreductase alpha subunit
MSELWDIGQSQPWDIHDEDEVEEEIEEYRPRFEENLQEEPPTHPYKIYRNIVESQELSEKQKAAVYYLKDEYADKWKEAKKDEVNSCSA